MVFRYLGVFSFGCICHSPDKDRKFWGIPRNPDKILKKSPDKEICGQEQTF